MSFGKKEKEVKKPESKSFFESKKLVAKKDFKIVHNEYVRDIKVGDDLSDVPEMYIQNLKSEQII